MPKITVDIGNKQLDASVKNELKNLKSKITRLENKVRKLEEKLQARRNDADFYSDFTQTFRNFFDGWKSDFEDD